MAATNWTYSNNLRNKSLLTRFQIRDIKHEWGHCQKFDQFQFQDSFVFAPDNPLTAWDRKYNWMLHSEVIRFWRRAAYNVETDNHDVMAGSKLRRTPRRKSRWSSQMMEKNRYLQLVTRNFVDGGSKTERPIFHFHAVRGKQIVGLYLE